MANKRSRDITDIDTVTAPDSKQACVDVFAYLLPELWGEVAGYLTVQQQLLGLGLVSKTFSGRALPLKRITTAEFTADAWGILGFGIRVHAGMPPNLSCWLVPPPSPKRLFPAHSLTSIGLVPLVSHDRRYPNQEIGDLIFQWLAKHQTNVRSLGVSSNFQCRPTADRAVDIVLARLVELRIVHEEVVIGFGFKREPVEFFPIGIMSHSNLRKLSVTTHLHPHVFQGNYVEQADGTWGYQSITRLHALELSSIYISEIADRMPNLEELYLDAVFPEQYARGLTRLARLTKLDALNYGGNLLFATGEPADSIMFLTKLISLRVVHHESRFPMPLVAEMFAPLSSLRYLECDYPGAWKMTMNKDVAPLATTTFY